MIEKKRRSQPESALTALLSIAVEYMGDHLLTQVKNNSHCFLFSKVSK